MKTEYFTLIFLAIEIALRNLPTKWNLSIIDFIVRLAGFLSRNHSSDGSIWVLRKEPLKDEDDNEPPTLKFA